VSFQDGGCFAAGGSPYSIYYLAAGFLSGPISEPSGPVSSLGTVRKVSVRKVPGERDGPAGLLFIYSVSFSKAPKVAGLDKGLCELALSDNLITSTID